MRRHFLSLLFIVGACLTAAPVRAADISVVPAFQTITTAQTTTAAVTLLNQTTAPVSFNLSLAGITATDLYGRLKFNAPLPQTIKPAESQVATIKPESLSLEPGETASVSVLFHPQMLSKGSNNFLLLAEVITQPVSPANHQQVKQYLGSAIMVNHSENNLVGLAIAGFTWDNLPLRFSLPTEMNLTLKNTGNVNSTPRGVIQITDTFNREIGRGSLNDTSVVIVPGSQRLIKGKLYPTTRLPLIAWVTLKLSGYDSSKQSSFTLTKSWLSVSPWLLAGLGGGLAIAGLIIFRPRKSS